MLLTTLPTPVLALSESDEAGEIRSTNTLHLTTIIREVEQKVWPGATQGDFSEADLTAFAEGGFMWERLVGSFWRDVAVKRADGRLFRPGEVEKDGIVGSPDAIDVEDWVVEEYKARWASSNSDIKDVWKYWAQLKAYCHMVGTTRGRLRVWYVCGNWRPPVPVVKGWEAEFTERELEDNWQMLVNHARSRGWLR